MTTQAVTDIKELVGERELGACECRFNSCPGRHAVKEECGSPPQWMARVHAVDDEGAHIDAVVKMCDVCLAAIRAFTDRQLWQGVCGCGIPVSKWLGPVMPL